MRCGRPGLMFAEAEVRSRSCELLNVVSAQSAADRSHVGAHLARVDQRSCPSSLSCPRSLAVMAPWAGRRPDSRDRRPLLLLGFGVFPIRALLFTVIADPTPLLALQLLDGISGTVLGVLRALLMAGLKKRHRPIQLGARSRRRHGRPLCQNWSG